LNQGNSEFSPKRCSGFHQCWRMPNTLTRHEPFRLFSLGHLTRTCVWGALWTVCKLTEIQKKINTTRSSATAKSTAHPSF